MVLCFDLTLRITNVDCAAVILIKWICELIILLLIHVLLDGMALASHWYLLVWCNLHTRIVLGYHIRHITCMLWLYSMHVCWLHLIYMLRQRLLPWLPIRKHKASWYRVTVE